MKSVAKMSLGELAAYISSHLSFSGIHTTLSGGACVSIYSENKYQSYDLDFIEDSVFGSKELQDRMGEIGFEKDGRYYKHHETKFFVEFPPGPLTVGDEPVIKRNFREFETGKLILLSPTDCIKDRLAGYYHWHDNQCLVQAHLVAESEYIEIDELERWSEHEGKLDIFVKIAKKFRKAQRAIRKNNRKSEE